MSGAYFNEFDPHAAAWLRQLMANGLIPHGVVDERPIQEVRAADLAGFRECHFFAGIGGWPLALGLAGWPEARPVWTGSCPCQPYSSAGKQRGNADERNLWPHFFRLIRECRPECVFGEQVEGAIRHGWLDGVCADLEAEGYAVGACVLGAHSAGAPHIRQRLFWVADHAGHGREQGRRGVEERSGSRDNRSVGDVAHTKGKRRNARRAGEAGNRGPLQPSGLRSPGELGDTNGAGSQPRRPAPATNGHGRSALADGSARGVGHAAEQRCEVPGEVDAPGPAERWSTEPGVPSGAGFWGEFDLIPCRDGKARRVEPGTFPLAHGLPGRVGLLRGYGNAICPQTAALFVQAFLETEGAT